MGDFSASPADALAANVQKGYVGLHVEQGVPVLDRDLNLLQDLVVDQVRRLFGTFVGDGVPVADGFGIVALDPPADDFRIAAGTSGRGSALVGGLHVQIPAPISYSQQEGVPALTAPTDGQPDPRQDVVYLDARVIEVDGRTDPDLTNSVDICIQTSTRLQIRWQVLVAENATPPGPAPGHVHYPLARLARPHGKAGITQSMITDLRQQGLTLADLVGRLALVESVLLLPAFDPLPKPQFVPQTGVVNQAVTLNGRNFDVGTISVFFGSTPATIVETSSPTRMVVRVPPGLTPQGQPVRLGITVSNQGGSATSDSEFVVLAPPAFADPGNQFSPTNGTPGTPVTLNGFNFDIGTPLVTFNEAPAQVVSGPDANTLVVEVPFGVVPPGQISADARITITNEGGADTSDDVFHAVLQRFPSTRSG